MSTEIGSAVPETMQVKIDEMARQIVAQLDKQAQTAMLACW